jgi:hypothetical protein
MSKEFSFGALFSKPDVRDYVASTTVTEFPDEFELQLPKVKNQGSVSSCVAHALSIVVEYFNKKESGKYTQMSTGYIYGNRRFTLHKGKGLYTKDAIKTVAKYGNVPHKLFPVNVEVPDAIDEFEAVVDSIESEGYFFKFHEYFKLKDKDAIKESLMTNGPAIMSMNWYNDIKVVDGVMQTECSRNNKTGGHCMVIYGWDETGWKVRNSWGRNWGNKGNVIIPYNIPLREVWGIKDAAADSSLIVKKPFSTKFGAWIAKALNAVIGLAYDIFNKNKEQ